MTKLQWTDRFIDRVTGIFEHRSPDSDFIIRPGGSPRPCYQRMACTLEPRFPGKLLGRGAHDRRQDGPTSRTMVRFLCGKVGGGVPVHAGRTQVGGGPRQGGVFPPLHPPASASGPFGDGKPEVLADGVLAAVDLYPVDGGRHSGKFAILPNRVVVLLLGHA